MSFAPSQVEEMWWDVYNRALDEQGLRSSPRSIEQIIGPEAADAEAAADMWTKKNVTADEWRAFTNARGNDHHRPDRPGTTLRQVSTLPKRQRRRDAKQNARELVAAQALAERLIGSQQRPN